MQLSELELKEIRSFEKQIPSLFTGFIADDSLQGRSNTNAIFSYLIGRGLPFTVSNLTAAVVALQFTLIWFPGTEPVPVVAPNDKRPSDGRKYEPTLHSDRANGVESSLEKSIREGKEKAAKEKAAKEKAALRFKEVNQVVQNKVNGGTDYAASNALNEQARRRHEAEDAAEARAAGKPIPVAITTKIRDISDDETNFTKYSAEELKKHVAKKKGRPGEPHGSLLR